MNIRKRKKVKMPPIPDPYKSKKHQQARRYLDERGIDIKPLWRTQGVG